MLHVALLLASVSKVPFYVAGLVLVAWAVGIAAYGLTRPGFPATAGAQRGVIAVSVVLGLVALAMAVHTSTFHG
jgi:hypothetical protein